MGDNYNMENKVVVIREYNEDKDIEVVGKLEKECEAINGSKSNNINTTNKAMVSIFSNIIFGDPLCRIKFYPLHFMLVAENCESGQVVGVVKGCIKCVGTRVGPSGSNSFLRFGCILGLRVSPTHRRMGIGFELVKSAEEWLISNGAQYTFVATEKNNLASINLFTKSNYTKLSSLHIYVLPTTTPLKLPSQSIRIERLNMDHAISLYKNKLLRVKDMYLKDIDSILKDRLSLGTWLIYFKEDEVNIEHDNIITRNKNISSSWAIFSIWNSYEAYNKNGSVCNNSNKKKLHSHTFKFFHATLSHARDKILPCLRLPMRYESCNMVKKPLGFFFIYGIFGEGERLQELMGSMWSFASKLANENVKGDYCKVIITELGVADPIFDYIVPLELASNISCIDDLWLLKKVNGNDCNEDHEHFGLRSEVGNVFVDPRDF